MAKRQGINRFGLDPNELRKVNWKLAASRVLVDIRSDFIYAPHISNVFRNATDTLIDKVKAELRAGQFGPAGPITVDVPKSARMHVIPRGSRGPTFSRPGSILLPRERLFYQALADKAAPLVEANTDRTRSFSHQLRSGNKVEMFEASRASWDKMQKALNTLSATDGGYVLKIDVANCFASINQHVLINHLEAIEYPATLRSALDALLVLNTGDRNSRGLIQGVWPSDLLGNFYLTPIDQKCADLGVPSVRYVDDIYAYASSLADAERLMRELSTALRNYDLTINEAKSKLLRSRSVLIEEPDLEYLFNKALEELRETDVDTDYGFQSEWDYGEDADDDADDSESDDSLELGATISLFESMDDFPAHVEKIERFCLPLFAAAGSDHAVDHVLSALTARPAMTQIYCSYLAAFLEDKKVKTALEGMYTSNSVYYDWQRMWVAASLMTAESNSDKMVLGALRTYRDGRSDEALRAVAAVFAAKHGSFTRQKELADNYGMTNSTYLQTAILYGTRYFRAASRRTLLKSWSGQSDTHTLVAESISPS